MPSRATGLGVFLLSASLMSTEVILTRVFSVVVWYHFAFFAISVALFGTGAAALFVHLRQDKLPREDTGQLLAQSSVGLCFSIIGVGLLLIHVTPNWFGDVEPSVFTRLTVKLVLLFVTTAAPFFVGGFALALVMTRYSAAVHRLYSWDLFGAGLGCLVVVPVISWLGGPRSLLFSAALGATAALAFASGPKRARWRLFAGLAFAFSVTLAAVDPMTHWFRVTVAKGWDLRKIKPELNRWNSFSMVTVLPEVGFRGWGLSPAYDGRFPKQKTVVIDMNAMTPLTQFDGNLDTVGYALYDLSALVYRLRPDPPEVCVIGAGGGKDVLAALVAGAGRVTAVEINPLIVNDVVRGAYREFTAGLYDRDDVVVVVEDGRSFARRSTDHYDVLMLSMVDTSAATAAGAYALTENSLYTTDAFVDFFRRLKPGGILNVSTASLEGLAVGARLTAVARTALLREERDPSRSVMVAQTGWIDSNGAVLHDLLIKPDGFTDAEVSLFAGAVADLRFVPAYLPARSLAPRDVEQSWMQQILTASDTAALRVKMDSWPIDVSAVDDNRPFFFYQNRFADLGDMMLSSDGGHLFGNGGGILAKVVVVSTGLVLVFLLLPLIVGRAQIRAGAGHPGWDMAYVACLGFGFMFLEIPWIQKFSLFLGNPTYTLAVVLAVLLVFGGLGSRLLAGRNATGSRHLLPLQLIALVTYSLGLSWGLTPLFELGAAWTPETRAVVVAVLLMPLGLLLGVPYPSGLGRVATRAEARIPWLWSINSATSVLGSVLATVCSLHAGINASLVVGALLYATALLIWIPMSQPS
ncbi:MAG: hypothetical protein HRU17_09915 [Polyangiaceae bacterium]|nr:hypothetical protein [Polyangiaceae bacterium]